MGEREAEADVVWWHQMISVFPSMKQEMAEITQGNVRLRFDSCRENKIASKRKELSN